MGKIDWEKANRRELQKPQARKPTPIRRGDYPATPKQRAYLRSFGYDYDERTLTRREARRLIDDFRAMKR